MVEAHFAVRIAMISESDCEAFVTPMFAVLDADIDHLKGRLRRSGGFGRASEEWSRCRATVMRSSSHAALRTA
jgi:hypothetical protein